MTALDAVRYYTRANNGSRGAQLPLKQLPLLLLFRYFLFGFFLRCHVDLLTSYVVGFRANSFCFCTPKSSITF